MMMLSVLSIVLLAASSGWGALAVSYSGFTQRYAGLTLPTEIVVLKPQPDYYRWWAVSRNGTIVTFAQAATKQADVKTVLDISSRVHLGSGYTEYGLINMLFSPNFVTDRQFYIYYQDERSGYQNDPTKLTSGRLNPLLAGFDVSSCWTSDGWPMTAMVSRFTYYEGDPTKTLNSEKVIIYWGLRNARSHSGGGMAFVGQDLYIATGDNANSWQGQSLDTVKGKVLRINPFVPSGTKPYSIPGDNPFTSFSAKKWHPEIFMYGCRNPWRCDVSPDEEVVCSVVGQDDVESLHVLKNGYNQGWPDYEGGNTCYSGGIYGYSGNRLNSTCPPTSLNIGCTTQPSTYNLQPPIFTYCHDGTDASLPRYQGGVCSPLLRGTVVILDGFYTGAGDGTGTLQKGDLIFHDPAAGRTNRPTMMRLRKVNGVWQPAVWYDSSPGPSYVITTGFDWAGEIYVISLRSSEIYTMNKFTYKAYPNGPVPSPAPTPALPAPTPKTPTPAPTPKTPTPAPTPKTPTPAPTPKTPTPAPTPKAPTPTSSTPPETCNAYLAQCGGKTWTGAICCQSGLYCKYSNENWSGCKYISSKPSVPLVNVCSSSTPFNYPELTWTLNSDGSYKGTVTFNAIQYQNSYGTTTTRGYFKGTTAMIPGPIIRMKPGTTYYLTVVNSLSTGWANSTGTFNGFRKPVSTNLHVHGLHVSPTTPADDVGVEISPGGKSFQYKYVIPDDHAGGTHAYHAHFHGSSALQAGAGAVGMLIIDDNKFIEKNTAGWPTMPEAKIVMQAMEPTRTAAVATATSDSLYVTTATSNHYLVNGCDAASFKMTINKGQWTRLRMLHIGTIAGSVVVTLKSRTSGATPCTAALLAKDGVYLSSTPRTLSEAKFLFSIASRADVAVRCTSTGTYDFSVASVNSATTPIFQAAVTVSGTGSTAANLNVWKPLRPYYLKSLTSQATPSNPYDVSLRNGAINDYVFTEPSGAPMLSFNEGSMLQWNVLFSGAHPFHAHVNHMQLLTIGGSYAAALSNWHAVGDWLDVIDFPADVTVRFRADRFGGIVHLHCHIYQHSDQGMVALVKINGGQGPSGTGTGTRVPHWPSGLPNAVCGNGILELGEVTDAC